MLSHQDLVEVHGLLQTFKQFLFFFTRMLPILQLQHFACFQNLHLQHPLDLRSAQARAQSDSFAQVNHAFLNLQDRLLSVHFFLANHDERFAMHLMSLDLLLVKLFGLYSVFNHPIKFAIPFTR